MELLDKLYLKPKLGKLERPKTYREIKKTKKTKKLKRKICRVVLYYSDTSSDES